MKIIWKLQYEFGDARINCFIWQQYSSWLICFCAFKIWYCKKQHMYCFLPFGFINVIIFVNNPSGSYSTFVGADLEYPISLSFDRCTWSELGYFDFEPSLKLWCHRAQDFHSPLSANITKWSNTLKQFVGMPTNCLSMFDLCGIGA